MKNYLVVSITFLIVVSPAKVRADDFYVVNGTYKVQKEAQKIAAIKGGWVLPTNFYPNFPQDLFAVVRGPYQTKEKAEERLNTLISGGRYAGSYVQNAGVIDLNAGFGGKKLKPQMIAALLGEILIEVNESKGGDNPCEPQEPYEQLNLSYITVELDWDAKEQKGLTQPKSVPLNIGGFWYIKSSGLIDRMRICME